MHLSVPPQNSEPVSTVYKADALSPAIRSRILEVVSSARMLGKAEILSELDPEADKSVCAEFDQRVKRALEGLETFIEKEILLASLPLPEHDDQLFMPHAKPSEPEAAEAEFAPAVQTQPVRHEHYRDWDEDRPRFAAAPTIIFAVAALGLALHWVYGGSFGGSAFEDYMSRQRCIAVADAVLDINNGRTPGISGSQDALIRENSACHAAVTQSSLQP